MHPRSPGFSSTGWTRHRTRRHSLRPYRPEVGEKLTWKQTKEQVLDLAAGLVSLGIGIEDRVAIASSTRLEWVLADFAVMCSGGATTTVYPSTAAGRRRLHPVRLGLPGGVRRRRRPGREGQVRQPFRPAGDRHVRWHRRRRVRAVPRPTRRPRSRAVGREARHHHRYRRPAHPGAPRDADLHVGHHRPAEGRAAGARLLDVRGRRHRLARHPAPPTTCSTCGCRCPTSFGKVLLASSSASASPPRSTADLDKLVENLAAIKPTFMAAVPRIFEKVYNRIIATGAGGRRDQGEDLRLGARRRASRYRGCASRRSKPCRPALALQHKHRRQAGVRARSSNVLGGRIRFFVSGSAPLSREIAEFFHAVGHADPRGLRPDRDQRRDVRQPARRLQVRHGRPADPRHRDRSSRRRRDPAARAGRDARLSQPAGATAEALDRRRLVPHRRHRRARRTASCGSPIARRT